LQNTFQTRWVFPYLLRTFEHLPARSAVAEGLGEEYKLYESLMVSLVCKLKLQHFIQGTNKRLRRQRNFFALSKEVFCLAGWERQLFDFFENFLMYAF